MMRILCSALALAWGLASAAGLEARPQTAAPQKVDAFYLKLLDAGERSMKTGAFTAATRDLEIAVFGLARDPRLMGKAYVLLAVCRDAMLDKDKSRANLTTAAGLLGPQGAAGLGLDDPTLAVVRTLVEAYKIPLAVPPPAAAKAEPKPAAPETKKPAAAPPAAKIEKTAPETKKPSRATKGEDPRETRKQETKPAAQKPEAERRQEPARSPNKAEAPRNKVATESESPPPTKVPTKKEAAPLKKETPPPAKETLRIEGPKPVFRPPAESLPDVKDLEKKLAADPANAGLVYEIVPRYFERKEFKSARRALEGLRAKRPLELRARLLLAKTDFFLKDYATSLEELRAISDPSAKVRPGPDESRAVSLYMAFCLAYLNEFRSAASILASVRASLTPEEFASFVETEGLATHWALISPRFSK